MGEPEEHWNTEWLRCLHLFNVVVRDAEQCATHMPITKVTVDLDDFYKTLVKKQQRNLLTLFSAYATQDAAAAFRLAEICHLDLAERFPEVIISNCDQMPFFALARQRALEETSRIGLWTSLLSEAALRSRAVASWMRDADPIKEWKKFVEEVPSKQHWFKSWLCEASFYTQSLTIALGPKAIVSDELVVLNLLRQIPPPATYSMTNGYLLFLLITTVYAAALVTSILHIRHHLILPHSTFSLLFVIPIMVLYYFVLRSLELKMTYRNLLYGMKKRTILPGIFRFMDYIPRTGIVGKRFARILQKVKEQRESGFSKENRPID